MGELNLQIKVLKRSTPLLFTWWDTEINSAEGYLVTCPCQDLDLSEEQGNPKRRKVKKSPQQAADSAWSMELGEALLRAEIVSIPVGAEHGSILLREEEKSCSSAEMPLLNMQADQSVDAKRMDDDGKDKGDQDEEDKGNTGKAGMNSSAHSGKVQPGSDRGGNEHGVERTGFRNKDGHIGNARYGKYLSSQEEENSIDGGDRISGGKGRGVGQDESAGDTSQEGCYPIVATEVRTREGEVGQCRNIADDVQKKPDIHVVGSVKHFEMTGVYGCSLNAPGDVDNPQERQNMPSTSKEDGTGWYEMVKNHQKLDKNAGDGHGGDHEGEISELEKGAIHPSIINEKDTPQQSKVVERHVSTDVSEERELTPTCDDGRQSNGNGLDPQPSTFVGNNSGSSQLMVEHGPGSVTSNAHGLTQDKIFASVEGQMISVDNIPTDSVVVFQDGKGPLSDVDRALIEVLKGLWQSPGHEAKEIKVSGTEPHQDTSASSGSKHLDDNLVTVDPVYAINTPAMVKYREHKKRLFLKKLHQTSEGSSKSQMTICEICGAIISIRQIRRHMKYMHSSKEPERNHECQACGKRFHKNDSLVRHERTHFEPTFHCSRCDKSFRHNFQLQNHERVHSGFEPPKRIQKPRYKTANPKPRVSIRNSDSANGQGVVECPVCKSKMGTRSLGRHMKMQHAGVPCGSYGCDICEEKFSTKARLHTHTLTHSGLKFFCGFCRQEFSEDLERVRHERTHIDVNQTGVKFQCGFCEKTYSRVRDRLCHEMSHFDPSIDLSHGSQNRTQPLVSKTVQCPICNKALKQNSMKSHMDSHSGKTWTCGTCGKTISKGAKYDHVKLHTGVKDHACTYCPAKFHTKHALVAHIRKHTQEKPVPCRFCDRKFARYEGRNNHEREHTGLRPYHCGICQKAWKDRPTYAQHMKKHHPGEPLVTRKRPGAALIPRLPGVPVI